MRFIKNALVDVFWSAVIENPAFQGFFSGANAFHQERLKKLRQRAEFYHREIERAQKLIASNHGSRWLNSTPSDSERDIYGSVYWACVERDKLFAKKQAVEQEIANIEKKERRNQYEIAKAERTSRGEATLLDKFDDARIVIRRWLGIILAAFFMLLVVKTCIAQPETNQTPSYVLVSEDRSLQIQQLRSYQEACATENPSNSYLATSGVRGLLYPSKCSPYGTDVAEYRFVDISGAQRCTGNAVVVFGGRENSIISYWEIKGAASGYSCSTIGKSYEMRMRAVKQK